MTNDEPTPDAPIDDQQFKSAVVDLLAGIEAQLTRIGDNTGRADIHVTEDAIRKAWPYRLYEDDLVGVFRELGITVD